MINQVIKEGANTLLSNGIQDIGYLLVIDSTFSIIAISENCNSWLIDDLPHLFDRNIWDTLNEYLPNYIDTIHVAVAQILNEKNDRLLMDILLNGIDCYLSIYTNFGFIYLEFEKKVLDDSVFFPKFEIFSKILLNKNEEIWDKLADYISKISGYDRVRIYRDMGEGVGKIIAESIINTEVQSIKGCYYPDMDIFKHAKNIHEINLSRYTAKIDNPTVKVLSKDELPINLSTTSIRMLSPIHAQYLIQDGVNSNLSISILINQKLWGYVFCQSQLPRQVNLMKREALVYLVQLAVNKYLDNKAIKERSFLEDVRKFELLLKEQLIVKNDIAKVLHAMANHLCFFAKADACVIIYNEHIYSYQISIGKHKVRSILQLINSIDENYIYTDNKFSLKYGHILDIDVKRFSGIAKVDIESNRRFSLLFFRNEKITEKTWVEKPSTLIDLNLPNKQFTSLHHPKFDFWHQKTFNSSLPWGKQENLFFQRLKKLIKQSTSQKSKEISNLKEEVNTLNIALDNYANTVSHDLKNPLSAINLSIQMLMQKPDMSEDIRQKLLGNTKEAVDLMKEMLSRIHDFSKVKAFDYIPEPVYAEEFIPQIVLFSKMRYYAENTKVHLDNLLPVYGEKTIIYQLFQNLIGNAIKYSSRKENPEVCINAKLEDEFVKYTIKDNGIGIAKEELTNIYDSFKRMSNASDFEGSGLGLSIVKRIVDRLDLQIKVESKLGKGTTIHLLFPNEN